MKNQILTTITVNLMALVYGISSGWIAPNLVRFQSENSPIGQISADQASLVVSIVYLGGIIGTLLFGYFADRCGRKWTLLAIAVPHMIANGLVLAGTHPYYVYAARFLFGVGGGAMFLLVPMFVAEIANNR